MLQTTQAKAYATNNTGYKQHRLKPMLQTKQTKTNRSKQTEEFEK